MPITENFLDTEMMEAASAIRIYSAQKSLQDSKKVRQIHVDHASIAKYDWGIWKKAEPVYQ